MIAWEQVLDAITQHIHDHASKIVTAALLMAIGWFLGRRRARAEWRRRQFFDLINFSLNIVENGTLLIRTLAEKRCSEVFLNPAACDTVMAAARKTTVDDPLLPLPKDDYWYYLNYVLNELSEQFAAGTLKRDMGLPVNVATYIICLTREADGGVRSQKIRAMLIRKESFDLWRTQSLTQGKETVGGGTLAVLKETHKTRVKTLRVLATEFEKHPYKFLEVELAV